MVPAGLNDTESVKNYLTNNHDTLLIRWSEQQHCHVACLYQDGDIQQKPLNVFENGNIRLGNNDYSNAPMPFDDFLKKYQQFEGKKLEITPEAVSNGASLEKYQQPDNNIIRNSDQTKSTSKKSGSFLKKLGNKIRNILPAALLNIVMNPRRQLLTPHLHRQASLLTQHLLNPASLRLPPPRFTTIALTRRDS